MGRRGRTHVRFGSAAAMPWQGRHQAAAAAAGARARRDCGCTRKILTGSAQDDHFALGVGGRGETPGDANPKGLLTSAQQAVHLAFADRAKQGWMEMGEGKGSGAPKYPRAYNRVKMEVDQGAAGGVSEGKATQQRRQRPLGKRPTECGVCSCSIVRLIVLLTSLLLP